MKIIRLRTLSGPNVYAHFPVIKMTLDLGDLAEVHSAALPGFVERLLALLPGLATHRCSIGRPGGFVERLGRGTYFAHIVEHVALELSEPAGIRVGFGKARATSKPGVAHVVVEFADEPAMIVLLRAAVDLCASLARGEAYDPSAAIAEAKHIADRRRLGPSTAALVAAAERRGIPWSRLNDRSLIAFGYGCRRKLVQATTSSGTGFIGTEVASDKQLTKSLLERAGIQVPRSIVVHSEAEAIAATKALRGPVVVKPLDGNQGRGVSLDLRTDDEVRAAYARARKHRPRVLVEALLEGKNYRVLVVGGRMVAAAERIPPCVKGDGMSTVRALVTRENENPLRCEGHAGALSKIPLDEVALAHLSRQGLAPHDVPTEGAVVWLRDSANLSTGGTARDVTDDVHPLLARTCERAARVVGLDICGIDVVCEDVARPFDTGQPVIIELNAAPGIRMHHHPTEGTPRDVAGAIVDMLYPPGTPSRVPVISVTGTNGKTTTTRLIAHVMAHPGRVVGMTTTDGVYVGDVEVRRGDRTGPVSASAVLFDPAVEVAVLETARGGIVRRGLGYDLADVAVITNIAEDHIGQDDVASVEDLVHVKALVAERVCRGGTVVLNAEDPRLVELASHPRVARPGVNVVLFSTDPRNFALLRHTARGGTGYTVERGVIIEIRDEETRAVVRVQDIPITFGGALMCATANVLATIAACRALDVTCQSLAFALADFDHDKNPGRLNVYEVRGGRAVVDYGHNPAAFAAIADLARVFAPTRRTAVISVPGDRLDDAVRASAASVARHFDRIIIKEDQNRRGRSPGETARLLAAAATDHGAECVIELDERRAVALALSSMREGELVVFFTDVPDVARQEIAMHGGRPTTETRKPRASMIELLAPGDGDLEMAG